MGNCFSAPRGLDTEEYDKTVEYARNLEPADKQMFLRAKDRAFAGMSKENEGKWDGGFEFIWLGDPQLGFGDQSMEEEFARQTVKFINERSRSANIKFVVVCGDHTHNLEGIWAKDKFSVQEAREKRTAQIEAYKKIWLKLKSNIPLVCVCGNHDVGNAPTDETIGLYKQEFGDDYLAFWAGGVKFIAINSQLIQHPEESGDLADKHDVWFENELKQDRDRTQIVLAHIPPFCWNADENYTNFNWPKEVRKKWLDRMVDAGVKNMYCAHYHRKAKGNYKSLKVMVTGALGTSIFTKAVPEDIKGDEVEEASFKVSGKSFGGLGANEEESGLHVVTVRAENDVSESWMTISDINKEMVAY